MRTIYARKEPTIDLYTRTAWPKGKHRDVVFYADAEATREVARRDWKKGELNRKRQHITLRGKTYPLEWLDDLKS